MHHPKNFVQWFFGWDETRPNLKSRPLDGEVFFLPHAPWPSSFFFFAFPTPRKPSSYLPLTSLIFLSFFLPASPFPLTIFSLIFLFLPISIFLFPLFNPFFLFSILIFGFWPIFDVFSFNFLNKNSLFFHFGCFFSCVCVCVSFF